MYFKEQRFEKDKSSTLASTHKVELPETGLIDSIILQLAAKNHTNVALDAPCNMWHHITKIEVIGDTDKTLFSLTGEEAIAKAYRKMKKLPAFTHNEYGNKTQWQNIPIFFGRRYKDGHYALDLSKWDKVELQVTNDMSSSYFSTLSMETRLVSIEEPVESYAKFMKQWEYDKSAAIADKQNVYVKLPTTGRLRELMVQLDPTLTATTAAVAKNPISDNYNWKLWFKDRGLTIRDHRPKDLMRDEHLQSGLGIGEAQVKAYPSTTRYTDLLWGYVIGVAKAEIRDDSTIATCYTMSDSQDRYQVAANVGTAIFVDIISKGIGLFHTFAIPWFINDTEDEYLDLDRYKPIEIEWYPYEAGNTHRLILEKPIGQGASEFA